MGIPSYFSYIVKNHPRIIKKFYKEQNTKNVKNTVKINNLYLDCNSIIYDAVHSISSEKDVGAKATISSVDTNSIINIVLAKIEEYILLLKPDKYVYIAFDGVAPVAKLEQQRQRRYKSQYQNNISQGIFKDFKITKTNAWDTTAITPGTQFMSTLNKRCAAFFNNPSKYNLKSIILSGSDQPQEGEHKLFQFIRDNPNEHSELSTVIYGLDADLIMLSIHHIPYCKSIYLFRETPHFIQSISKDLEPNDTYLLDIPELAQKIGEEMGVNTHTQGQPFSTDNNNNNLKHCYDYIFLCFFLGNDFLPHFPALNIRTGGVDKMMMAYSACIKEEERLVEPVNGKIVWKNVRKVVAYLSAQEDKYIQEEHLQRNKREKFYYPTDTPENTFKKFEGLPNYERTTEKYINPMVDGWENRYYEVLFDVEATEERIEQICVNYLEGLEWTMKYYSNGCPDWRWRYNYNYPPLLKDLIKHIPLYDRTFVEGKSPLSQTPVSELTQLCYVLPKQSLYLLPKEILDKLGDKKQEWYKSDCTFVWAYCRYFWEAHVELPEIEVDLLVKMVV
jgi:5'-3' exonuclease